MTRSQRTRKRAPRRDKDGKEYRRPGARAAADVVAELMPLRHKLAAALTDHPDVGFDRRRLLDAGLTANDAARAAGIEWKTLDRDATSGVSTWEGLRNRSEDPDRHGRRTGWALHRQRSPEDETGSPSYANDAAGRAPHALYRLLRRFRRRGQKAHGVRLSRFDLPHRYKPVACAAQRSREGPPPESPSPRRHDRRGIVRAEEITTRSSLRACGAAADGTNNAAA
jgi:hypothetical protein